MTTRTQPLVWTHETVSFKNFTSDAAPLEEGVTATYDLDPEHQRDVVHSNAWQAQVVDTALTFGTIPTVYFHTRLNSDGISIKESLDGKQRCMSVVNFLRGAYSMALPQFGHPKPVKFHQLERRHQQQVEDCKLDIKICTQELTPQEIKKFFNRAQQTKKTTTGEFLNSCTSSWRKEAYKRSRDRIAPFLDRIGGDGARHAHLEMFARIWYAFESYGHPEGARAFFTTPKKLQAFWEAPAPTEDSVDAFMASLKIIDVIGQVGVPGISAHATYVPIYRYILEYGYSDGQLDNAEVTSLARLVTQPNVFNHVNGNHDAAQQRFNTLCLRLGKN